MYNDDDTRKSDEEYMLSLYRRFRNEVAAGGVIDYYELNELLDIYDYAQDEGDILVQMFVFMTASRLYPETREFDERLAFFLSYVSADAVNDLLAREGRKDTALWDTLRMGIECYSTGKDPTPYLEMIFSTYSRLDCETELKIVDLLRDGMHHDLLVKYYPELINHAEDPRGISFEIAEALKELADYNEDARRVAEDITRLEPFNVESWLLLARIEFGMEHPREALGAVDYALAIDPTYFNARLTRGVIMVVIDELRKEAIETLEQILTESPDNVFALEGLGEAYAREGRNEDAVKIYQRMAKENLSMATGGNPLVQIIDLSGDKLDENIDEFLANVNGADQDWVQVVHPMIEKGNFKLAARTLDYVYRKVKSHNITSLFIHTLYDAEMYDRFIEVYEELMKRYPVAAEKLFFTPTDLVLVASVYLRKGNKAKAASLAEYIEKIKDDTPTINDRFMLRGIKLTARLIRNLATQDHPGIDLSIFDPMTLEFND